MSTETVTTTPTAALKRGEPDGKKKALRSKAFE